jgi:hypothetical protein
VKKVKFLLVRNLMSQPIPLLPKNRHGDPLVVPARAKRFSVGPDHYETAQFKNLVKARRGNPAFLVVIGEEKLPVPEAKPPKPKPIPKLEKKTEDKIRSAETIETRESLAAKASVSSKKKATSKGDAAGAASAKSE